MSEVSALRRQVGQLLDFKWKHIYTVDRRTTIKWTVCAEDLHEVVLVLPRATTAEQVAAFINAKSEEKASCF